MLGRWADRIGPDADLFVLGFVVWEAVSGQWPCANDGKVKRTHLANSQQSATKLWHR